MRGSSDSDGAIKDVRHRFLSSSSSSSSSPTAFLTPAFAAAASACGSISNSPLNIDPSLLRFTQSRLNRLKFSSSSDESSKRLQQLLAVRSLSSSSRRSSSHTPLSPLENLRMKVEIGEDVLVMDALDESSSSSSSSVNSNFIGANLFFKTDVCRAWEEFGNCRFGSRCQFAHGKEELRGSTGSSKLKTESGKENSAVGSIIYGEKYVQSESSSDTGNMKIINPERDDHPPAQKQRPPFSWPPTNAQETKIQRVLYGPKRNGTRLPIFVDISK